VGVWECGSAVFYFLILDACYRTEIDDCGCIFPLMKIVVAQVEKGMGSDDED